MWIDELVRFMKVTYYDPTARWQRYRDYYYMEYGHSSMKVYPDGSIVINGEETHANAKDYSLSPPPHGRHLLDMIQAKSTQLIREEQPMDRLKEKAIPIDH